MGKEIQLIGKLEGGHSGGPVYDMAEAVVREWALPPASRVVDVGGGRGNFALVLSKVFNGPIDVLDHEVGSVDKRLKYTTMDLNEDFPVADNSYDAVVSLEVIEHLENPRHFLREIVRILKPDAPVLITTPNQLKLSSKLCLFFRDQFRDFQDCCYPAHITALLPRDLEHIARECGLKVAGFRFTNRDCFPLTTLEYQAVIPFLGGKWFSSNIGMIATKDK